MFSSATLLTVYTFFAFNFRHFWAFPSTTEASRCLSSFSLSSFFPSELTLPPLFRCSYSHWDFFSFSPLPLTHRMLKGPVLKPSCSTSATFPQPTSRSSSPPFCRPSLWTLLPDRFPSLGPRTSEVNHNSPPVFPAFRDGDPSPIPPSWPLSAVPFSHKRIFRIPKIRNVSSHHAPLLPAVRSADEKSSHVSPRHPIPSSFFLLFVIASGGWHAGYPFLLRPVLTEKSSFVLLLFDLPSPWLHSLFLRRKTRGDHSFLRVPLC